MAVLLYTIVLFTHKHYFTINFMMSTSMQQVCLEYEAIQNSKVPNCVTHSQTVRLERSVNGTGPVINTALY